MFNLKLKMLETYGDLLQHPKAPQYLVVMVKMPNDSIEIITNTDVHGKVAYYREAYDDEFRLKSNPEVQIINFMMI